MDRECLARRGRLPLAELHGGGKANTSLRNVYREHPAVARRIPVEFVEILEAADLPRGLVSDDVTMIANVDQLVRVAEPDPDTVRDLNSTIQSFPPVLIALPMGFTEEAFYQDDDPAIQSAPKVAFQRPGA